MSPAPELPRRCRPIAAIFVPSNIILSVHARRIRWPVVVLQMYEDSIFQSPMLKIEARTCGTAAA